MFRALVILAASISAASASKLLSVSLSGPASAVDVTGLEVVATITNTGDEALKLLNHPNTVLSKWATDSFDVSKEDGAAPEFAGLKVRYIPEVAATSGDESAFTVLLPGASVEITHEVGNFYNFNDAGNGVFTFTPHAAFQAIELDGSLTTIEATTTGTTIDLNGQLTTSSFISPASAGGVDLAKNASEKRATYRSCTSAQQTATAQAITDSAALASKASAHLTNNPSGSTAITTWFGSLTSARRSSGISSFNTLKTAPAGWTWDCSCKETGTYAFVNTGTYGTVNLCTLFFNVPATGSGSRADTIIHEGSHFNQVLGTDDVTYGETSCKALAKSNPASAFNNADNHAFFSVYAT